MLSFGPISSLFDIATFLFLYYVLCPVAVRRNDLSEPYGSGTAAAICGAVPDGVVSGIHVDTGADFTFPAHAQDSLLAKQTVAACNVYHLGGNRPVYRHYLYQGGSAVRLDRAAPLVLQFLLIVALLYMLLTTMVKVFYQKKYRELI